MTPRGFDNVSDAKRWSACGGVALCWLSKYERPRLYGNPCAGESFGWAMFWAGRCGTTFANVINRNTSDCYIDIHDITATKIGEYATPGPTRPKLLGSPILTTTVLYFTGTRNGCTDAQLEALRELVFMRHIISAHHGMCIGADHEFHTLMSGLKANSEYCEPWVVGWPAEVIPELTMHGKLHCDEIHTKLPPLSRNKAMAERAGWQIKMQVLGNGTLEPEHGFTVEAIACPDWSKPPADGRGGTLHAIKNFRAQGVPVLVVTPQGKVSQWVS